MTNRQPLDFLLQGEYRDKYPRRLVEQFPHVAWHLESIWRDKKVVADYLSDLMIPSRPNRKGFPSDVAAEIMSPSIAYDLIGHLVAPAETTKPANAGSYRWDEEPVVKEIEGLGFPFTRDGFVKAIEAGRDDVVQRFLKAGFDVDFRDARDWTPLMIAAFHGREALALQLIRFGVNLRATDRGGYSSMHWAAYSGFAQLVAVLLDHGLPANEVSNAGITPLLQAAARGHVDVVELLLAHQANPNLAAKDGSTPLVKAVANNHFRAVLALINAGAYCNVTLKDGTMLEALVNKAKDARIRALFA